MLLQSLQAFGGPGRTAISFAPTYSMYPEYARDTLTEWVAGHRAEDFSLDLDAARELVRREAWATLDALIRQRGIDTEGAA
jgi:histidinol-phosphate aminotransferase